VPPPNYFSPKTSANSHVKPPRSQLNKYLHTHQSLTPKK
jgi:hypothetical protein